MSLKQTIGANIRHYRKAEGLTQAQLAERVDLSTDMIGKIERGLTGPSYEKVEVLAQVLNVPEAALFSPTVMTLPTGERGRLLKKINIHLSRLNEEQLAQAEKVLAALT